MFFFYLAFSNLCCISRRAHSAATRNPKGDVDARGAHGVTARAIHRFNLLSTTHTRTAARSLARSLACSQSRARGCGIRGRVGDVDGGGGGAVE